MNRLSPIHKKMLNELAEIYAREDSFPYYSKKKLRYILRYFKWDKEAAIGAIKADKVWYFFADD